MDWREFWMPREAWQSTKIRELTDELAAAQRKGRKASRSLDDLARDVGLLILLQLLTLRTLLDKGLISREDLHARMMEIDKLDGIGDGRVDPDALRRILGLWISGQEEGQGPSKASAP
jgi:hypothetical protein